MPNVTPPANYDLPWKAALTHAFHAFMDFFFPELATQINWSRRPRFRDKELAGIGFSLLTLAHLRTQQARHDPDILYAAKWQLTKLLYQRRWSNQRILVLFKVINWMMALPESHEQQYWRAIHRLERRQKVKWISPLEQSFINKGLQKGIKKGRQEGLLRGRKQGLEQGLEQGLAQGWKEGAAALLKRQLRQRFGPLPKTVHNKLAKASVAQIGTWSDALPEARSLKQLFVKARELDSH